MNITNRVLLFVVLATGLIQASLADTTIVFNSFFPPQNFINTKVLPLWIHQVESVTDGRVRVVIPPKSVAPPDQLWEALSNGLADAGYLYNGFLPKDVQLPLIAQLPGLTSPSSKTMSVALWKTYQKYFKTKREYAKDFKVLSFFVAAPAEFYSISKTRFTSIDQIRKAKVWALPGTTASLMENAGISVVGGPAAHIQDFVSHGVVDAFVGIPYTDAQAFKASDYITSVTKFKHNLFAPGFSLVISESAWNRISPKDQKAIMSVSGEHFSKLIGSQYDRENQKALNDLKAHHVRFVNADARLQNTLEKAGKPLFAAWKKEATTKGVDADAAIGYYRSLIGQ